MIKNILKILFSVFLLFHISFSAVANCDITTMSDLDVSGQIGSCIEGTSTIATPGNDLKLEGTGFKDILNEWIARIAGGLLLVAIGSIAYGGFMMVMSAGEDEKIKKGKDIVKWSIFGSLGIVLASSIITIIINVMYSIGS